MRWDCLVAYRTSVPISQRSSLSHTTHIAWTYLTESLSTQCLTFPDSPELIFYYKAVEFHEITCAPCEIKFCSQHALKWLEVCLHSGVATGCARNAVTNVEIFAEVTVDIVL